MEHPNNAKSNANCGIERSGTTRSRQTCALAIWSFALAVTTPASVYIVFGIVIISSIIEFLALAIVPPVLALLFAMFALVRIVKSRGALRGQGFAIAAIGVLGLWPLLLIISPRTKVLHPRVWQKAQFHRIEAGLRLFDEEFDGYPSSDALDSAGQPYCGAMKLCEALVGKDLLGFHRDSVFRPDGLDATGQRDLYPEDPDEYNIRARRGPFIPAASANTHKLMDIYGPDSIGPFGDHTFVVCDTYTRKHKTGVVAGMPILYYKANPANSTHDVSNPDNPQNIYNYKDNHALVGLGVPGQPGMKHPLFRDPKIFYEMTRDYNITAQNRPFRADSYILLSAGKDGLYGTEDDIVNFDMRWKPKSRR
jgi:hypothetical protein